MAMTTTYGGGRGGESARIFGASDDPEINERARRAIQTFRAMQPGLSGFARMITKRDDVRVEMFGGVPCTDGKIIYLRPPIELGDRLDHVKSLCDKRDELDRPACSACCAREDVLITLYHEIAHIAFDSFETVSDHDKVELIKRAVKEAGVTNPERQRKIQERIESRNIRGYMEAAHAVSPYLPPILNALEDVRVNHAMYSARPGTFPMFRGQAVRIFNEGIQQADGSFKKWNEMGRNAQVIVGLFAKAAGYNEYNDGWFSDDVTDALNDPDLTALVAKVPTLRSARQVYQLVFPILERLRGLGFCKAKDDPEEDLPEPPMPEPQEEDEDDDPKPEGEGETDEQTPDGEEEENDGGTYGEPCEDGDPSDEPQDSEPTNPDGDADGDGEGENEGESDDEAAGETSSDDQSEDDDDATGEGAGDGGDSTEGDDEAEGESGGDDEEDGQGAGDGEGESSDEEGESGSGAGGSDEESADEGDEGEAGTSGGSGAEGDGEEPATDGEPGEDDGESDGEGEGDGGESGGDLPYDGPSTPSIPEDDDEPGSGDGPGEEFIPEDADEDADDANVALNVFGGHGPIPDNPETDVENAAIDRNIAQEAFDAPSRNIFGVREHRWDKHAFDPSGRDMTELLSWSNRYNYGGYNEYFGTDVNLLMAPETVLGPSLLRMRAAFAENKRADVQRNLKSGRVDAAVLGRRIAAKDDRLFMKKKYPGKRDYFVVIGMDLSGSTASGIIKLIKQAAMAQAELCHRAGVRFAVYGHTGYFHDMRNPDRAEYGGSGMDVEIFVVKEEDEAWDTAAKERLAALVPAQANLDGHTLEYYRKRCDQSRATDKIILYYTDGYMPAENEDEEIVVLQREIKLCKQRGYTLLGVGCETDSPIRHGLDTVQIDTIEDLPLAVRHLEKRLAIKR